MFKKFDKKYLFILLIVLIFIGFIILKPEYINNYYDYVNHTTISDKEDNWAYIDSKNDEINDNIKEIIDTTNDSNIKKLYDLSKVKSTSTTLNKYIDLINNSNNINEFINNSITIEKELSINFLSNYTIMRDFKDDGNILYFTSILGDYGVNLDYYSNDDLSNIRQYFKLYNIKLLMKYGYTKGNALDISTSVDKFYRDLAINSLSSNELQDTSKYYNKISLNKFSKIYSNIDINKYFEKLGLNVNEVSLVDEKFYKKFNSYLTNDNLPLLKNVMVLRILQSLGEYTKDYSDIILSFNNKLYDIDKEDYSYELVKSYYPNLISKSYNEKYLSDNDKNKLENMTKDIIKEYNNIINNSWMESTTKDKAREKLNNIKVNIGNRYIPDFVSSYNIDENKDLISNIIKMNQEINNNYLKYLDKDIDYPSLADYNVNAYYDITDNSINILTGISTLLNDNYYENIGSVGTIIAHEISHAFDNNGSKFNKNGKLEEWYSKKDREEYNGIINKVIDYYNNYEVIHKIYNDGKKTIGENIADLAALECITSMLKDVSDNDIKKAFNAYASLWASNYTNSAKVSLYLVDVHSISEIRVNGTLSSNDLFYDVYNLNSKDTMYVDKDKRVRIWS